MRHHAPGVSEQGCEEVVFLGREADWFAGARNGSLVEIHCDAANLDSLNRFRYPCLVTERGAQSCGQFADPERLLDVVVRAEVKGLDLVHLAVARRRYDDGRRGRLSEFAQ